MNNSLKSGLVLLVIGLVCGILLAFVNSITAPEIAANELASKMEAIESYYDLEDYDYDVLEDIEGLEALFVLKQDNVIEALVYQVSATGYNGPVTMLIAVNKDLTVEGYKVLTHKEDAGFGADIVANDFNIAEIANVGTYEDFDSVSGATYTSKAIWGCFNIVAQRVSDDFGGGLDD